MRKLAFLFPLVVCLGCGDDDGAGNNQNNGNQNGNVTLPVCGNGEVELGETCDDGATNSDVDPDACRTDCRPAYCGDGVVDSTEQCDEGGANSDRIANACRTACVEPTCGDGVLDAGEDCDDGNAADGDGCSAACAVETYWTCDEQPSVCACLPYRRSAGCAECVVYVNAASTAETPDGKTWATAFPRIQDGVDTAAAATADATCAVRVAGGHYEVVDFSPLDSLELRDRVEVLGGFAGTEDASEARDLEAYRTEVSGATNVYHVVTADHVNGVVLDGLVIQQGFADGSEAKDQRGGGLYLYGSEVTLRRCLVGANQALRSGGGIHATGSVVTIERSQIGPNDARADLGDEGGLGGALSVDDAHLRVYDTVFVGNYAAVAGGAVHVRRGTFVGQNVVLAGNQSWLDGGAIYGMDDAFFTLNHATAVGNWSNRGGAFFLAPGSGAFLVRNSLLWSNRSDDPTEPDLLRDGGPTFPDNVAYSLVDLDATAIYSGPGNLVGDPGLVGAPLHEGTWTAAADYASGGYYVFVDETASFAPGSLAGAFLMLAQSYAPWMRIRGNTEHEVFVDPLCRSCTVQASTPYQIFDLRLDEGSICLDAASSDVTYLIDHDLEGHPRDATPDLGAYERQ